MVARVSIPAMHKLLRERFGHASFQPGHEELVARLLAGGDVVAEFAAGSGERVCYQLLACVSQQPTLVVTSQRATLRQEVERLQGKGLAAASCEGGSARGAVAGVGARLSHGTLRLLYVTGESLHDAAVWAMLNHVHWALVVLEQAQQACRCSPQYRPGWRWVFEQVRRLPGERKLYLAETGSAGALAELAGLVPGAEMVRGPWWRPNVALQGAMVARHELEEAVLERLAARPAGAALICCPGPDQTEQIASAICAAGRAARAVHSGMKPQARQAACEWFLGSEQPVLVSAMPLAGLPQRADLRAVYLCQLPADAHELLAAAARAGRDGLHAVCDMLISSADATALENQIRAAVPDVSILHALLDELLSGPRQKLFSKHQAAQRYDLSVRVVEDVLDWLALEGVLAEGATAPRQMRFKCLEPLPRIVGRFQGERAAFLKRVFGTARRARTWHYLDLKVAEARLADSFERALAALHYLGRCGLLDLHASGMHTHIERVAALPEADYAARRVREQLLAMRDQRLCAVQALRAVFSHAGCWLERLGAYLGYSQQRPCGMCTWCTSGQSLAEQVNHIAFSEALWDRLRAVQAQHAQTLMPPAAAAKFLCGISTPRLVRERLTRHPLFGVCRHVPVADVYRRVRTHGMQPAVAQS